MRLSRTVFFVFILIIGSGAILTRDNADAAYEELEAIGETNDPLLLDKKAILSNDLAVFYQTIQDDEQSIVFLKQALKYTKKRINIEQNWNFQDLKDLQDLYLNLARIQGTGGFVDDAQQSFLEAESYFNKLKKHLTTPEFNYAAYSLYGTGFSSSYHGRQYELSESYGLKSLYYAKKTKKPQIISKAYRQLGELFNRMGKSELAIEYVKKGIDCIRKDDSQAQLDHHLVRSYIAWYYNHKQYDQVIDFMENELLYASPSAFNDSLQNYSLHEFGTIFENTFIFSYAYIRQFQKSGDVQLLTKAKEWQTTAYDNIELVLLENGIDKLGQVLENPKQKITSTLKNYEMLDEEGVLSQQEIGQLLKTIDAYHATQLHISRLKDEINGTNWQKQKDLRAALEGIFDTIENAPENAPYLDSLQQESFEISSEISDLSLSIKRKEITKEYRTSQGQFLKQIHQFTKTQKKTILTYFWSEQLSRLYIIGKNPKEYFFESVELPKAFTTSINASYQLNSHFLTSQENLKEQDSLNQYLYEKLITPVKNKLITNNLLVYPIGAMSYISVDALKPSENQYLIEKFNTSYTSSLFALLRNKKVKSTTNTAAAFYPKNYGNDSLMALYYAKDEIAVLDSCATIQKFEGKRATKKEFLSIANKSRILHVASHSILDSENPFNSYLIFDQQAHPDDSHLKASEVFSQSINAELIVLSSCNSSKGKLGEETGIVSLSNAFYYSGVPSTVGSIWSSQDYCSSKIIVGFYRNLFQNESKSVSLTKAKRNYLSRADAVKRQPFFWANFVLYGSDAPIQLEDKKGEWLPKAIFIILMMIVPFLVYKRSRRSFA